MNTHSSNLMPLEEALVLKSPFIEYTRFEGDGEARAIEVGKFVADQVLLPNYDYPRLHGLYDAAEVGEKDISTQKTELQNAVFSLEYARLNGGLDENRAELFVRLHETRLKRIMLTELAKAMLTAAGGGEQEVLRNRFMDLNRELYGEMDEAAWLGIISSEKQRITEFEPQNNRAASVKDYLERVLLVYNPTEVEVELVDEELLRVYRPFIESRYAHVLAVVPDTTIDIKYDAKQCAEIMQQALDAGGLGGWKVLIDPKKSNPSTNAAKQTISLPANTQRNADELKRLILHEQEVHARRGDNAKKYPALPLLESGTADYLDVEEGLGLFLEMVLAGTADNPAVHRARDRYITAGLALGLGDRAPRDARQTFEVLWRMIAVRGSSDGILTDENVLKAKKVAYSHIENAYRGTIFAGRGLIYTKLKVYYEGLVKNVDYIREIGKDENKFEEIFVGKYNHTDAAERKLVKGIIGS